MGYLPISVETDVCVCVCGAGHLSVFVMSSGEGWVLSPGICLNVRKVSDAGLLK